MKPGYKKSRKKIDKANKKSAKPEVVNDAAMEVDEASIVTRKNKKQRRRDALAVKQRTKSELLKKTTSKFKKLVARDVAGATNLARNRLGAAELQYTQQRVADLVTQQDGAVGDVEMQEK